MAKRQFKFKTKTHKFSKANALLALFPDDVLIEIFLSLRNLYTHNSDLKDRKRLGWIVVSHISQRWRNVALGCGKLWGHIHSADPAVAEWLNRAGDAPIAATMEVKAASDEDTLIVLLKRLSQIQALSIQIKSSITPVTYQRIWYHLRVIYSSPAPLLAVLEVNDEIGVRNPHRSLFDNKAPVLRHFSSRGFLPMLPSPCFNHLIGFVVCQPSEPLNKFTLLTQLGSMSNLQYLMVQNALVPMEQMLDTSPNFPVSRLPKLEHFIFHGTYFNTDLDFLSHLSFPEVTSVTFVSALRSTDFSAFPRFIDAYNQTRDPPPPTRMLKLTWGDQLVQLIAAPMVISSDRDENADTLTLILDGPWGDAVFPTSWGEDLLELPLSDLEYFLTDCALGLPTWRLLSKKCSKINHLSLEGWASMEFIYVFLEDYKDNCPSYEFAPEKFEGIMEGMSREEITAKLTEVFNWKNPKFSDLRTLELVGANLRGARPMFVLLQRALRDRRLFCESFVEELVIKDCKYVEFWMIEMMKKVVKVRWNSVVYPWTNEMGNENLDKNYEEEWNT